MPSLQVRDVPNHLYLKLKHAADQEHRSLAQEAIVVLARGLGMEEAPKDRRKRLLDGIRKNPPVAEGKSYPDPVALIREDRER